jgi:hypothetical protein
VRNTLALAGLGLDQQRYRKLAEVQTYYDEGGARLGRVYSSRVRQVQVGGEYDA